jgi:DNA-binding protein Fis
MSDLPGNSEHGPEERLEERLYARFNMECQIRDFAVAMQALLPFDRFGVASRVNQRELEVIALYPAGQNQQRDIGRRFPYRGTAGEWAWKRKQPFIGRTREEIRAFQTTFRQFEADGMQSNCVIAMPMPDRGPTFAYWMSKSEHCYGPHNISALLRASDYLKPILFSSDNIEHIYRQSGSPLRKALDRLFITERAEKSKATLPSLNDVQAQYIRSVLEHTQGLIEGQEGAAAILGLPASTLRSRMRKLGIARD